MQPLHRQHMWSLLKDTRERGQKEVCAWDQIAMLYDVRTNLQMHSGAFTWLRNLALEVLESG